MAMDEIDLEMSHSRQRALRRKRVIAICAERRERDLRTQQLERHRRLKQQEKDENAEKSIGKNHDAISTTSHEEEVISSRYTSPNISRNPSVQSSPRSPNLLEERTPCTHQKKSPDAGNTLNRYSKLTRESNSPHGFNRASITSSSSPGSKLGEEYKTHASPKKSAPSSPSILRYGKFSRFPTKPSPTKVAFDGSINEKKICDDEIEYRGDFTKDALSSATRMSYISNDKTTSSLEIEANSYSHFSQTGVTALPKTALETAASPPSSKTNNLASYGANETSTTEVNSFSQSSQQSTTSNRSKKKPWQTALHFDDDDDDDDFTFDEMTRVSRMKKKQALKTLTKGTEAGAEKPPRGQTKSTISKEPSAGESTVKQLAEVDAAINAEGKSLIVRKTAATVEIITKHGHEHIISRKKRFGIDESSSDEDIEEYCRKRPLRHEFNEIGQSSSQSTLPQNLACKRSAADKNEFQSALMRHNSDCSGQQQTKSATRKTNPQSLTALPLTTKNLNQNALSDSDDSEKDYLASKQAVLAKIQAKRDAKYKNNPLAIEKRDNEEWREKILNGSALGISFSAGDPRVGPKTLKQRIGTEVLIKQESEDIAKNSNFCKSRSDATKLSRSRQRSITKRRHEKIYNNFADETISSLGSPPDDMPLPSKKLCGGSSLPDSAICKKSGDDEDKLWDDSDDCGGNSSDSGCDTGNGKSRSKKRLHESSVEEKKRLLRSRKPPSNDHSRDTSPQARNPAASFETSHERPNSMQSNGGTTSKMFLSKDYEEDLLFSDDDRIRQELKPDFKDPKLGPPSDLVPLFLPPKYKPRISPLNVLEVSDDEIEDSDADEIVMAEDDKMGKVPASINRYLQDYQREGIRFMYASVINNKGCVLGDDMGLGKTVQLISLIAALLNMTGTGTDALENKRRQRRLMRMIEEREKNEDQALVTGIYSGFQNSSVLDGIGIPECVPILIIVPSSVIKNWQNELKEWGHFDVGVYSGQSRENAIERIKAGLDFILITGKSLFTRDVDFCNFIGIQWKLVVVDEFHEYKNPDSKSHKCLLNIRDKSRCPIIGMTGTLMQNNHDELFHLMDLARPSLLGDKQSFTEYIAKPIKYARAKDASEETKMLAKRRELGLVRTLSKAYLSRKKTDVLKESLKQKNEKVLFCELSEIQKKIYRHVVTLPDFHILKTMNGACDCGVNQQYFKGFLKMKSRKEQIDYQRRHKSQLVAMKNCCYKYPYNTNKENPGDPDINPDAVLWKQKHEKIVEDPSLIDGHIFDGKYVACEQCPSCILFPAIHKLVKIASHPSLLQVDRIDSGRDAQKKLEFAKIALTPDILRELPGQSYYKADSIMNDHYKLSGKMRALDHLLEKYQRKNHRVLVFSYSVQMLDLIQQHVKTRGYSNLRLDGTVPTSSRQPLVDKFQNDESIFMFLISTKAGGLGLNLTAANKVIIFDVNWNPSYDEQAQDRSFRIGQKKNVEVVRLVSRGTIEELVYCRQVYKVQLKKQTFGSLMNDENQPQIFRGVSQDQNRKGELFGVENLLSFKDGSFMDKIWKTASNTKEVFDASKLGDDLAKINPEDLEMGVEGEDQLQGEKNHSPMKNFVQKNSDDDDNSEVSDSGFNHEDYFRQDRGRARVLEGEDGYEEEMGGESQVIQVTTKLACQNMGIFSTDDCYYQSDSRVQTRKEPALPSIQEKNIPRSDGTSHVGDSAVPSPTTSSNAFSSRPDIVNRSYVDDPVNLTSGCYKAKDINLSQQEIMYKSQGMSIVNSHISLKDPTDNDSLSFAYVSNQSTAKAENASAVHWQHKDSFTSSVPKSIQNNPARFSLMGVIFENTGRKNKDTSLKEHGLYIPAYTKRRSK